MDKEPGGGFGPILAAVGMVACCVGIPLLAAGALSGLGAWLNDGRLIWLALAFVLAVGGVYLWRRPKSSAIDTNPAIEARRDDSKPSVTDRE